MLRTRRAGVRIRKKLALDFIKLALLSLVQDYSRLREIAEGLVELARPSPELSKFVGDQLEMLSVSSWRTALRVIAGAFAEGRKSNPPVFIVTEDESQSLRDKQLAQALEEKGITVQRVDFLSAAKPAELIFSREIGDSLRRGRESRRVPDRTVGDRQEVHGTGSRIDGGFRPE
jgi:hypothetical protein